MERHYEKERDYDKADDWETNSCGVTHSFQKSNDTLYVPYLFGRFLL